MPCSFSKSTVPFGSASRRINSLTQNHRIYMTALIDGTNKINRAILIREHLKVCFEQEFLFLEEMLLLLNSGIEPLKSWNSLCLVGLHTGPVFSHPFLGISTSTYTKARVTQESWISSFLCVSAESSVLRPLLWCISAKAQIANRKNFDFVGHLEMKEVWCFTSQPSGRESQLLNQGELVGESRELEPELHIYSQHS